MYSMLAHIPGLKVALPTTPRDAKGLLISAIRDDDPVIIIEHRWLYWQEDEVPEEPYEIPLGEPNTIRRGDDLTIVATSWMNVEALEAAEILKRRGVEVEIIDPRTIAPFNEEAIITSVRKTGYCIVADNDWLNCGFSAEAAARISEHCLKDLKSPVARLGFAPTPCPTARHLEDAFYPNAVDIIRTAEKMLGLEGADLSGESFYNYEHRFKGPF
jgi:pyruvate dehydrogenase E1 component beta subunit